jgi:hypothetical protein
VIREHEIKRIEKRPDGSVLVTMKSHTKSFGINPLRFTLHLIAILALCVIVFLGWRWLYSN